MIGTTVSHYRILEELGGGGMGVVYKAEDTKLGRLVALKFLGEELSRDPEAIRRFQREARAASSLNHPNICTIYEFDEHEGRQFIVMELMEGQTLKHRIEGQALATEEIVALAAQFCEGLAAAHQRGIIHRDIKPANLFVGASGQAKVLDFGVAKLLPREDDATLTGTQTVGGPALGTLAYMAPEQLNREKVDARTDLYALGCVLYEMATGQRPFQNELGAQRITSILSRMPDPPSKLNPEVPAWLDAIILKCLEKKPEGRYQSAKELQGELQRLAAPLAGAERSAVPEGGTGLNWLRKRWVVVGVAVVLLFAVLLGLDVGEWRTRLLGGAGPPRIDSLAVLPLKNLMGDPEQDYFVEGMHEALTAELSKIGALKVISRTSTMSYKDTGKPMPQIARELGVAGLIEGSVLREGDQVRITVQLIHGPSDRHLWAQSFDRELRGILALHSEVARAIAREIRVQLTPQEQRRLASGLPVNPAAHEAYLRGRFYWNKRTGDNLRRAIEYFQQAIEKEPTFAPAYAGLADAYVVLPVHGGAPPNESIPRAKAAATKALEIDATLAEAHSALAYAMDLYDWDWAGAERQHRRALELNPGNANAHHWYALHLASVGRTEEALAEMKRAQELDPLSLMINANLGRMLVFARRVDDAIQQYRRTLELDPNLEYAHYALGSAYKLKRMYGEAIRELQKAVSLSGGNPMRLSLLARVYAESGNRTEALKLLEQLRELSKRSYVSPAAIALVYEAVGDKDRAFVWLEKAYEDHSIGLFFLKADPGFDTLRSDPRFQDLLRRMNFPN